MTENEIPATHPEDGSPTTLASLEIYGFTCLPEDVTRILRLQPTSFGRAGERHVNMGRVTSHILEHSFWDLRSGAGRSASIEEHVIDLLQQLRNSRQALTRLPASTAVKVRCTIIPNGYVPLVKISATTLASLSDLGASFEVRVITIRGGPDDDAVTTSPATGVVRN